MHDPDPGCPGTRFRFWSDTNQRVFELGLERSGIDYRAGGHFAELVVPEARDYAWIGELAHNLGADSLEPAVWEPEPEPGRQP